MPTPLDGIKLMKPEYLNGGGVEFKDLGLGTIVWEGKRYIYLNGGILGPVQKVIKRIHVESDHDKDSKRPPEIVMFGQGKKIGVYIAGVKSELFDEMGDFQFRNNHLWYVARRGNKWCYVIDGIIHGWYEEVMKCWVWFQPKDDGSSDLIYWAKKDGEVAFWLNGAPLELFPANSHEISSLAWEKDSIIFKVKVDLGNQHQEGLWADGSVQRWFEKLEGFVVRRTSDGLSYVGTTQEGKFLFFNGEYLGPYDHISPVPSSRLNLPPGTLVATFAKSGKAFAQIGEWISGEHQEIKGPDSVQGHRRVVGIDRIGTQKMYTYYVDETPVCTVPDENGFIRDGKLCFKQSVVTGYRIPKIPSDMGCSAD